MRTLGLLAWLMVPVLVGAYHYGPGQEKLRLDDVSRLLARADGLAAEQRWTQASSEYEKALALLPPGRIDESRRIRLQRARVQMLDRQLPEANAALEELVDQLEADRTASPRLREDARSALANSEYYLTWLMRLEGLGAADWEPQIEDARQTYRLLAEEAEARGDTVHSKTYRENLESTIRLSRMELAQLQGLDLPRQ